MTAVAGRGSDILLFDGVPVDASLDVFDCSDDDEPPDIDESTTFGWDAFILRTPEADRARQGRQKLRKAAKLAALTRAVGGGDSRSNAEIEAEFVENVEKHAKEMERRYKDGAVEHLSQLLAEIRAYGLQNLVEGQAQMPPSHAAVADRLAAEVGRVVSEELEHFSDQKTWSEDPKYPQHP